MMNPMNSGKMAPSAKSAVPRMSRNQKEMNRSYLKRRGDSGSVLEHLWQGKSGLKYPSSPVEK